MDIPASTGQVVTRFLVELPWEGTQWSINGVLNHLQCSELFSPFLTLFNHLSSLSNTSTMFLSQESH